MSEANPRVVIEIGPHLERIADAVIEALPNSGEVYQRSMLVDVVRNATSSAEGIVRVDGTPRIRALPQPRLREIMSRVVQFQAFKKLGRGKPQLVDVAPPNEIAAAIIARGQWRHVPRLKGIVTWPTMRPDGSILETSGYDHVTGLLCESMPSVDVPAHPTLDDAKAAATELLDVVSDFPFASDAHKATWLAMLLTPLTRAAFTGPSPLMVVTANARGTGKSMLAELVGAIVLGRALPCRTAPEDAPEWQKTMLGIALAGDPVLLIDNVTKMLRSDALDAVLTGTHFQGRILGKNEELAIEIQTLFVVTANNPIMSTDLGRRSLEIRLESPVERPEHRTGFRIVDLPAYCAEHRPQLLTAALTILRAYHCAGRPAVAMQAMGSYGAWSAAVRAPLVWAGLPDPALTQEGLRESSDPETEAAAALVECWHRVYGERAVTVRTVLGDLADTELAQQERDLRHAVAVLCDCEAGRLPSARHLGNRLRGLRGRIIGGLVFQASTQYDRNGQAWIARRWGPGCESRESGDSGFNPSRENQTVWNQREGLERHSQESSDSQGRLGFGWPGQRGDA